VRRFIIVVLLGLLVVPQAASLAYTYQGSIGGSDIANPSSFDWSPNGTLVAVYAGGTGNANLSVYYWDGAAFTFQAGLTNASGGGPTNAIWLTDTHIATAQSSTGNVNLWEYNASTRALAWRQKPAMTGLVQDIQGMDYGDGHLFVRGINGHVLSFDGSSLTSDSNLPALCPGGMARPTYVIHFPLGLAESASACNPRLRILTGAGASWNYDFNQTGWGVDVRGLVWNPLDDSITLAYRVNNTAFFLETFTQAVGGEWIMSQNLTLPGTEPRLITISPDGLNLIVFRVTVPHLIYERILGGWSLVGNAPMDQEFSLAVTHHTGWSLDGSAFLAPRANTTRSGWYSSDTPIPPPSVPLNLFAHGRSDRIELSWDAPESGVASQYKIYRAVETNETFVLLATIGSNLTFDDFEASVGVLYWYCVAAVGVGGESDCSNEDSAFVTTGLFGDEGGFIWGPDGPAPFAEAINTSVAGAKVFLGIIFLAPFAIIAWMLRRLSGVGLAGSVVLGVGVMIWALVGWIPASLVLYVAAVVGAFGVLRGPRVSEDASP
jgi:hypothetical protein